MSGFNITNFSGRDIWVFVSNYSGGDDRWFPLRVGQTDHWGRSGWELVAMKFWDEDRRGQYQYPRNQEIKIYGKDNIDWGM